MSKRRNPKFNPAKANAMNPNNRAFWQSRGYRDRPENWQELVESMDITTSSKSRLFKQQQKRESVFEIDAYGPLPADGFGRFSKDDY